MNLFISENTSPSNRDRLDAWYRKALPHLLERPGGWVRLRARGEAIKRQWRTDWAQRDAIQPDNIIPFQTRTTP